MPPRSASIGSGGAPAATTAASAPASTKGAAPAHYVPEFVPLHDVPFVGQHYSGLLGDNFKDKPFYQRLNWLHVTLLVGTPALALYGISQWTFQWRTLVWAVVWYFMTGLGITAGYHRLFAHRAYVAGTPLRVLLLLLGAGAFEGSVRWWSRDHRAHHRYVDTDRDPYAIIKGFWYAHVGWMLVKQDKEKIGRADISDLNADPWCRWQHAYYLPIAALMAVGVPTIVAGLGWGDWWGGYFVAGLARLVFVHHSTFCVNSLAHWAGDATYTDGHTARNSFITALVTVGEGYHNFHHEFPSDYRNAVEWYQYDPTKWFIAVTHMLGLSWSLNRFPANEINKGQLQMRQKALNAAKEALYWGPDPAQLPVWSKEKLAAAVTAGGKLVVLDGFVLDLAAFAPTHPGGAGLITNELGKDITAKFKGEYYKHSNAARNLSSTFRVARMGGYWT